MQPAASRPAGVRGHDGLVPGQFTPLAPVLLRDPRRLRCPLLAIPPARSSIPGACSVSLAVLGLGLSPLMPFPALGLTPKWLFDDFNFGRSVTATGLLVLYLVPALFLAWRQHWRVPVTALAIYAMTIIAGPLTLLAYEKEALW